MTPLPPLQRTLAGEAVRPMPIWLMRQAGRYLPSYRLIRSRFDHFLDFCFDPSSAAAVSLQPIELFDLDAAIVFADITCLPHVMGHPFQFVSHGPSCTAITNAESVTQLDAGKAAQGYEPIGETIARIRLSLPANKDVIGFVGAPFTIACYLLRGSDPPGDWSGVLHTAKQAPWFVDLLNRLADGAADALVTQAKAGASVVMIFDTWAGLLAPESNLFDLFITQPTRRLVSRLRDQVDVPMIAFPKNADPQLPDFIAAVQPEGLSVDSATPLSTMRQTLMEHSPHVPVLQGNIDPQSLIDGGPSLRQAWQNLNLSVAGIPHIVNLGHGVRPNTPPEHVHDLVALVREGL